jgi:hypothetical protein
VTERHLARSSLRSLGVLCVSAVKSLGRFEEHLAPNIFIASSFPIR